MEFLKHNIIVVINRPTVRLLYFTVIRYRLPDMIYDKYKESDSKPNRGVPRNLKRGGHYFLFPFPLKMSVKTKKRS